MNKRKKERKKGGRKKEREAEGKKKEEGLHNSPTTMKPDTITSNLVSMLTENLGRKEQEYSVIV